MILYKMRQVVLQINSINGHNDKNEMDFYYINSYDISKNTAILPFTISAETVPESSQYCPIKF